MKSRSINILIVLALLLSLLGSALTVTPARAASIVVNSNADIVANNGECTLREAITNASNNAATYPDCAAGSGADTITFAADYTITLSSPLSIVATTITITGNGAANTIIQASTCNPVTLPSGCTPATNRVFMISSGSNVILNDMTIRHGYCPSCVTGGTDGGGIWNGGTLTINNSSISDNKATNGGGIYNASGTLAITNSTLSGNNATSNGGGILNSNGTLTLTNSTLSGNSASIFGGGIYNNATGTLTLTNSTLSGNSATSRGGGIYNDDSLTLTNSTLSGNSASLLGGGIYNSAPATLTITNSTLSGNSANSGGGIYNPGTVTITNSTLSGNSASTSGGGIQNLDTVTITNSTLSGNSAFTSGGGIQNVGTVTITNSTLSGNSASTNGGGIRNILRLNLTNTIIANSTSGGDCNGGGSILTNVNNLIEDNSCSPAFSGDPNLGALANNGGSAQTHALLAGSSAIDKGDATACANAPVSNKDQRGVTRPIDGDAVAGAVCDIGAFEYGAIIPVVTASNPSASAVLTSLSSITVVFNQDMLDNASADGAENVNNYILVERGANLAFDTSSCKGGVVSDDVQQTIASASYNSAGFITSLILASPLANGTYRLFVCGTTSVWSAAGLELNNGANDYTVDFTIGTAAGTGGTAVTTRTRASSLPATGFAPKKVTTLPDQPATLEYANMGDLWLEIPSLNVKSTILGVPQNADKTWDVAWLGNDTGWLNGTAFPTWTGNSVLTAHVTNASGLDGPFAALKSLKYGDQIIVHMGGAQYIYEVRNSRLARPYSTSFAFESKQDAAYLTLITCQGYNPLNESYLFRRVVRAVLIEVK